MRITDLTHCLSRLLIAASSQTGLSRIAAGRQTEATTGESGRNGHWMRFWALALLSAGAVIAANPVSAQTAPLTDIQAVATGSSHTCALTSGGGVKCWGRNSDGQLGDNSTTHRLTPVDVVGLNSGVTALAAGQHHTCALTSGGGVKCWGHNDAGQLADNSTTTRLTPVDVSGLSSGVTALVAGLSQTCALLSGGGVKCWGLNGNGQLGNNSTTNSLVPVDVPALSSGVTALAAGQYHTCALMSSGGVKCWGRNGEGQLGDNSTTQSLTPVDVSGLNNGVTALAAGQLHTCAVVGGGVKCWGNNANGQLGDNSTTQRHVPVDVPALSSGVAALVAGEAHTCALTSSGGVKCWGNNGSGQLGDNSTTQRLTPVDANGLSSGVTALSAGQYHTCAVTSGGGLKCWGNNNYGQLGDISMNHLTPGDVSDLGSGMTAVATGQYHTCALTSSGGVKCWGNNQYGQLGDNSTTQRLAPVDVNGLSSGVTALAAGFNHTCALTSSGGVKCWGYNGGGQLGDNSAMTRLTPIDVNGLSSGVTALAAGELHTCALASDGVKCWGFNGFGQLGDNSMTTRPTPVAVSGLSSGVTALAAGQLHTCALMSGGGVKCWGFNGYGQLGDNSVTQRLTPVDVSSLSSGVTALAAGAYHTCALTGGGGMKCWGDNYRGQLGDNSTTTRLTPIAVNGLSSGVTVLAAGRSHTCAVTSGGVKCWGDNNYGQLGDNSKTNRLTPVVVNGLSGGAAALAAGESHTCAVTTGGGAKCWGYNNYGQVGDGTLLDKRAFPADVLVTVPDAPTGVSATLGSSGASVSFNAPASNGGATIDNYRATCTGGVTAAQTASPITVTGLTHGSNTCTVAAHNVAGWGAESTASASFTVDTSPTPFTFTDLTGQALNTQVTSNTITVGGINTAAAISISGTSGSQYRIGSGSWTSSAGTVNSGDTVTVRHTTSSGYYGTINTTLTIGGISDTFSSTTQGPPPPIDGVCGSANGQMSYLAPGSNLCRVGYNSWVIPDSPASYVWFCYGWDGGATASCSAPRGYLVTPTAGANGSLNPASQQTVAWNSTTTFTATPQAGYQVKNFSGCNGTRSGNTYSTGPVTADCGVNVAFEAIDTTPDPFSFIPQDNVTPASVIISNLVTVSGINTSVPISVSGGMYAVDGAPFTNVAGSVSNGQIVRAQLTASGSHSTMVAAVVTIGGVSGNFTVTTRDRQSPNPFGFTTINGAQRLMSYTSNVVTLSGLSGQGTAMVSGGELSIDGGAYGNGGTVKEGSTLQVRQTSGSKVGQRTRVTVTVGTTSGRFDVITQGGGMPWLMYLLR